MSRFTMLIGGTRRTFRARSLAEAVRMAGIVASVKLAVGLSFAELLAVQPD